MSMLTTERLLSGVRLMTPNETFKKLQRIKLSLHQLIKKKKETDRIVNGGSIDIDFSDPLMCSNGKRQRVFSKRDIEKDLFGGSTIRNLSEQMDKHGIGGCYIENNRTVWRVSQLERNQIAQRICNTFHPKVRLDCEKVQIFVINNLKGGGGKSTFTVSVGSALATALTQSLRVGIIDLDPQGSTTDILVPNLSELNPDSLSIGDLLMHNFEPLVFDEGETYEQCCRDAFLETNIPNVRICPALPTDTAFDYQSKAAAYEAAQGGKPYSVANLFQPIIDAVKDEFDVIIIDTPPQLNEASFGAFFCATSSIIPLRPSQNDRDSTSKYAEQLPEMYRNLVQQGHKGYDAVKMVVMSYMESSRAEREFKEDLHSLLQGDMLTPFKHSEAVKVCAEAFKTVFELSPSEYAKVDSESSKAAYGSRAQIEQAQENIINIAKEVEVILNTVWENQRKAAGVKNELDEQVEEL